MSFDPNRIPRAVWDVPFDDFVGPHDVNDAVYGFNGRAEDNAIHFEAEPAAGAAWTSQDGLYAVHPVADPDWQPSHTTLLVHRDDGAVGFYAGGMVWIDPAHRGRGLAAPLILAAAIEAGGVPYDNTEGLGFSEAGIAAHRAAHRIAVELALTAGEEVPPEVVAEHGLDLPSP